MSGLRRYNDDEIREIIRLASEVDAASGGGAVGAGDAQGMTLAQIQAIGAEVGLDPTLVARAAAEVGVASGQGDSGQRTLGVPTSVGHVVELPARLTDGEWDALVVRLRETFRARGKVIQDGGLRGWANGNLQVLEEPTPSGYRLRMRSVSGNAQGALVGGAMGVGLGVLILALAQLGSGLSPGEGLLLGGLFSGGGAALMMQGKAGASRWIATRKAQFRELAGWTTVRIAGRPGNSDPGLPPGG